MKIHYLTIDPGISGTGYALWSSPHWELMKTGIYSVSSDKVTWEHKGHIIAQNIAILCRNYSVRKICIEFPAYFDSSSGNMVAKRGDSVKLTWMVGMICGIVYPLKPVLVPVNNWKGQMPKDVVIRRIQKRLGVERCEELGIKSHMWDSVGVGLFASGKF